ncbi:MAG: T9SS type A sorting domain-containing protein [Saprospiraceae bacterium]
MREGELCFVKTRHDPTSPQFIKYWLLWMDKDGNEKVYISNPNINGTNHNYGIINPFFIKSDYVYFIASPSIIGKEGADILRPGIDGKLDILGSLTTGNTKRMTGYRINMKKSGYFVMFMVWDNIYTTACGFHISDFGINLSSEDQGLTPSKPLITLTPNPAGDDVSIYITDHQYHKGTAYIYDVSGQLVQQKKVQHGDKMDVGSLAPGTYIVQYAPESRPGYFLTGKLVKP